MDTVIDIIRAIDWPIAVTIVGVAFARSTRCARRHPYNR